MVLKVGTAVVTRQDGRLAVGKLGALCEQVALNICIFCVKFFVCSRNKDWILSLACVTLLRIHCRLRS